MTRLTRPLPPSSADPPSPLSTLHRHPLTTSPYPSQFASPSHESVNSNSCTRVDAFASIPSCLSTSHFFPFLLPSFLPSIFLFTRRFYSRSRDDDDDDSRYRLRYSRYDKYDRSAIHNARKTYNLRSTYALRVPYKVNEIKMSYFISNILLLSREEIEMREARLTQLRQMSPVKNLLSIQRRHVTFHVSYVDRWLFEKVNLLG